MNKKTTAWIIIAASLILIGILIFVGAMTMLKWDFTKLSTVKLETNEYCIGEEYKNISIEDSTADIEFKISDSFSANRFIAHGTVDQLLQECSLSSAQIAQRIKDAIHMTEKNNA